MNDSPWKKLSSKKVYENQYFKVREDKVIRPNNQPGKYFVIEMTPSVMIVAVDKDLQFYLIGQHRYTNNLFSWEIPGGSTDGEVVIDSAKRELQEETGLVSDDWENLGQQQVLNGSTDKLFTVLLAKNVRQTNKNEQETEGITQMKKVSFQILLEMIQRQEITDSETISSLMLSAIHLKLIS